MKVKEKAAFFFVLYASHVNATRRGMQVFGKVRGRCTSYFVLCTLCFAQKVEIPPTAVGGWVQIQPTTASVRQSYRAQRAGG